jgi:hypothetical protein
VTILTRPWLLRWSYSGASGSERERVGVIPARWGRELPGGCWVPCPNVGHSLHVDCRMQVGEQRAQTYEKCCYHSLTWSIIESRRTADETK